jgi:PIN domain nuclease of toxin-antitoxin system
MVSAISLWEIGIKIKRGNLELGVGLNEYVRRLQLLRAYL